MKNPAKVILVLCTLAILIFSSHPAMAAESIGHTTIKRGNVFEVYITWTAASDGSLTETGISTGLSGFVIMAITDPGTPAPTDNYNVVLKDENGIAIFGTALESRDTTNAEAAEPVISYRYVSGPWSFDITSNTVDSAQGIIKVYLMTK